MVCDYDRLVPLSLPKGSFGCQAEYAVLPFYLDRRTNLDRTGEWDHIMGPPVVYPLKKSDLDDICVLFESIPASHSAALVILCLHQQMNQSITFTIIHRPHHHIKILERPSKVILPEMTGLPLGCHDRVLSLCPSSTAWVNPDRRRTGGCSNTSWHPEKLWLLGGLRGRAGWMVWVAAEG